ncbi:beta-ureidopropionase-like [Agrilus planipennis]|uniref:Beta-ureidopropionase-like n=1 Tax=Agrilus planipennis TaxID=224129 RepID=A0A7F5RE08_AGRPL|nr:beta-ureidopropionase-like [Agrilus planipennis]XP_025834212.1 beta-ureidopropionase-like [Agrilus planipennis]
MSRRSSVLWKIFTIEDQVKNLARCDICRQLFSYKTSISNLKKHLLKKHPTVQILDNVIRYDPEQIQEHQNDPSSDITTEDIQELDEEKCEILEQRKVHRNRKRSPLWNIFIQKSNNSKVAICKICKKELCYNSTTTNLHKHLKRKHPNVILKDEEEINKEENRSRSPSRSPLPNSTFEVYVEAPDQDHQYVTVELPGSTFSSLMDPIEVPSLVPISVADNIHLKEENYKRRQLPHIDDIIRKLNIEDQQQIKQLLYGTNYEVLKLPTTIVQQVRNLRFELASYKFLSAPEQVRTPRLIRLAALQITLPLPTSTPIIEMRKAIHDRAAEAIEIASQVNVNIFCLQELWTSPFFLCTGEKYPWCEYAEPAESGPTTEFLKELAKKYNMVIISPILERDELHNDTVWNTAVVIDNHGDVLGKHRKNHISRVTGFNESTYYNEGNTGHPVFQTDFGRIAINISHGRHHPLNWMMFGINGAEIVFNPSVEAGAESELLWNIESRCAAMNNSFFTCAINRVGTEKFPKEKFGHLYGSTYVTAPDGTRTPGLSRTRDGILITEFDLNMCRRARDFWGFQTTRRLDLYAESFAKVAKLDYQPQIIKK